MAKLVVAGDEDRTEYVIDGVVTIGRNSSNDIPIKAEKVGRRWWYNASSVAAYKRKNGKEGLDDQENVCVQ